MLDFYPRPPRGGRHGRAGGVLLLDLFLSTPSARRATFVLPDGWEVDPYFYPRPPRGGRRAGIAPCGHCSEYFYPRPPRGGRLDVLVVLKVVAKFLSTPSARRATLNVCFRDALRKISIHALREEGDDPRSAHRESEKDFYPRPPRGGRPNYDANIGSRLQISIHALREEGDGVTPRPSRARRISIHALREEGDPKQHHQRQTV